MSLRSRSIAKSFKDLSDSISESDEIMIETRLLMYRFLSEIDKITSERGINRKELAKLAGTSASYITQLYQGKKIINLHMLTKIKKALNIDFKIEIETTEQNTQADCDIIRSTSIRATSQKTLYAMAHGKGTPQIT